MSIGWRLAQAGARVELFERDRAGRASSWAAAGMLAAGIETEPSEEPLLVLGQRSQALWPSFARELGDASGIDVGHRTEGSLRIALTRDEAAQLRYVYDFQRKLGIGLDWLSGEALAAREPHLSPRIAGALFSPHDHQVDNRELVPALIAAFQRAGGTLHEEAPVSRIDIANGRATGVHVDGTLHAADTIVLAAGAWSRGIDGVPEELRPRVRPVKGQMIALQMDPAAPLLHHVLWTPQAYIVPRRNGRLLVGASVEERGFDRSITAGAVMALLDAAWRAIPATEDLPINEIWAGFRPGSPDDAPILGPSGIDGLVLATGHYRNGILLTPVTADLVSTFILTGVADNLLAKFSPARFETVEEGS